MTISELLEELMRLDHETWEIIECGIPLKPLDQYFTFGYGKKTAYQCRDAYLPVLQMEKEVALVWIQDCLQRACEKRGWTWCIYKQTPEEKHSHYAEINKIIPGYDGDCYNQYHESCIAWKEADTPAEALLTAYIAAVKKEGKQ